MLLNQEKHPKKKEENYHFPLQEIPQEFPAANLSCQPFGAGVNTLIPTS